MAEDFNKLITNDQFQNQSGQGYISGSSSYSLALSDYLYNQRGLPRPVDQLPFYIQLESEQGETVALDLLDGTKIVGIKLIINPTSISFNMSKIANRTQTMTGWFEEHWGEELDTVTFQGSSATFILGGRVQRDISYGTGPYGAGEFLRDYGTRQSFNDAFGLQDPFSQTPETGKALEDSIQIGLTTGKRRMSVAYQEFRRITNIMNSNGCVFDNQGFVVERNFIRLGFDYATLLGYFESIDITEDALSPFRFTYTITFKSEKTVFWYI